MNALVNSVLKREDIPLDVAERIIAGIDNELTRSGGLRVVSLKKGVPLKKARELANKIKIEPIKSITLKELVLRALDDGDWKQALEIAADISDPRERSEALGTLSISDQLPLNVAERTADRIPDEELKSNALGILAIGENVPLKKALEIANRIPLELWKSTTLFQLALRALKEASWKGAFEIALSIPDPNKRSDALSRISLAMPAAMKKEALEVALSIPDPLVRSDTLFEWAMNRGLLYPAALEIVNMIPDPNIKQRALSLLQVRRGTALSSLRIGAL